MASDQGAVDADEGGQLALKTADLRDQIEKAKRRMRGAVGASVAVTAIFSVSALFMERAGTLWFFGVMWCVLNLRFVMVRRSAGQEMRGREIALESLADARGVLPTEAQGRQSGVAESVRRQANR